MRKLSKIKLQDAVVLENSEMKTIFGGTGRACDPYAVTCEGTCQTINGNGLCTRNSETYLYCACVLI